MTKTTFAAVLTFASLTTALSAQTITPQPTPAQPPRTETAQTMTLTGCLKPYDPATMMAGSSSGEGTAEGKAMQQYVLVEAEPSAKMSPAAGTTSPGAAQPPTGTSPMMGAHLTYLLKNSGTIDFAAYVDQKVDALGTMAVSITAAAPTHGGMTSKPAASMHSTFTVTTITSVSKTCS